jgi:hypothetical protein
MWAAMLTNPGRNVERIRIALVFQYGPSNRNSREACDGHDFATANVRDRISFRVSVSPRDNCLSVRIVLSAKRFAPAVTRFARRAAGMYRLAIVRHIVTSSGYPNRVNSPVKIPAAKANSQNARTIRVSGMP